MKKKLNFKGIDKIFVEDLNSLSENTLLKNLTNWDSLKQLELISLLEKNLKKKLSIQEILKIKTLKDLKKKIK
jgi:acyl carrier protein